MLFGPSFNSLRPESDFTAPHSAALDSTAVRKIPTEPTGAAKIFQFHCKTNILHSVFTLKSRIQVYIYFEITDSGSNETICFKLVLIVNCHKVFY
ncbi:MAG: hypothetical protein OFPII_00380 [Osedax symbiont Rs1]|nr:MAG: hypothetical protein OFPII_00380 [Osedax symbiont Rs1]